MTISLTTNDHISHVSDAQSLDQFPGLDSNIAISVQNLTKIYKLYDSPMDRLRESLHPLRKKYHHDYYALKEVSFEIKKGETVGIVGKNGSGKSTLLKLVTGVLSPSSGTVAVNGSVSALLELGAGFNAELTGLENIYFNGTLMGYSRNEINEKLDAILSFADIGEFVHQPVKIYSSGMFVRLAFAVAISVDPEILIVDEALAVGDEAFQRKCFSRIKDIQEQGKTILLVSHSTAMIVDLCSRAILFDQGELFLSGTPRPIVARYQRLLYTPGEKMAAIKEELRASSSYNDTLEEMSVSPENLTQKLSLSAFYDPNLQPQSTVSYESRGAIISDARILSMDGKQVNVLIHGEEYTYTFTVSFEEDAYNVRFGTLIKTLTGFELGGMVSHTREDSIDFIEKGAVMQPHFGFRCSLLPGVYFMNAGVVGSINHTELPLHRIIDALMLKVQPATNKLVHGIVNFSVTSPPAQVTRIR